MALRITLEEAIERFGHQKGVRNYEVIRALGARAKTSKAVPGSQIVGPCIIRVKGPARRHHLTLFEDGKVHDPYFPLPAPNLQDWLDWTAKCGWRVVSTFPLHESEL